MANVMSVLKSEISRLARREAKQVVAPVQKASANYRGLIAGLRKQIDALQNEVAALRRAAPKAEKALAAAQEPQGRFWDHRQGRQGPAQAPRAHTGKFRQAGGRERAYGSQLGGIEGQGTDPAKGGDCPAAGHSGDGQEAGGECAGDGKGQGA